MADSKITALTELTTPASGDMLAIVDDPGGSPVTKKVTLQNISDLIAVTEPNNASSIHRQAIINGNFDVWQRGTSFTITTNGYTVDRWRIGHDTAIPTTETVTRQSFTAGQTDVPNNPLYFLRTTITDIGTCSGVAQEQRIEDVNKFSGVNVTISFWAKSDSASGDTITPRIGQLFGSGGSAYVETNGTAKDLTNSWQYFTQTIAVPSVSGKTIGAGSSINVKLSLPASNGVYDIAQVQLCAGDVALPFMPKSFDQEKSDCERYFQIFGGGSLGNCASDTVFEAAFKFNKPMRTVPPTMAIIAQPSITEIGAGTKTATGSAIAATYSKSLTSFSGSFIGFTGLNSGNKAFTKNDFLSADAEL